MCSPGGRFVVTGGSDHVVRVYRIDDQCGPLKTHELDGHRDSVDSLVWESTPIALGKAVLRFASASKDGVAIVWTLKGQNWQATRIDVGAHARKQQQQPCVP